MFKTLIPILYYKYEFWCNFNTVLCQFLETVTSDRTNIGASARTNIGASDRTNIGASDRTNIGASAYTLFHFTLTVPFRIWLNSVDLVEPLLLFTGSCSKEVAQFSLHRSSTFSNFSLNLIPGQSAIPPTPSTDIDEKFGVSVRGKIHVQLYSENSARNHGTNKSTGATFHC